MQKNGLDALIEQEKNARDLGFEWPDVQMILDQAISEVEEVRQAIEEGSQSHIQEEIGDLLHTAISLCIFVGFNTEETLDKASKKFAIRMEALKTIAAERGFTSLKNQPPEFLMGLWREAKIRTK